VALSTINSLFKDSLKDEARGLFIKYGSDFSFDNGHPLLMSSVLCRISNGDGETGADSSPSTRYSVHIWSKPNAGFSG